MWGVFIFILGIFGIFLINLFGVITTTNQQDYTLLKNAVEASMVDAVDYASYRLGFYLCPSNSGLSDSNDQMVFKSKNDYHIVLRTPNILEDVSNCRLLTGEIKLNEEVFVESFLRRFANNINNNKSYDITIQEVIEYPPKVSVRIDTYNTYGSREATTATFDTGDYNIRNQIDAIFEDKRS